MRKSLKYIDIVEFINFWVRRFVFKPFLRYILNICISFNLFLISVVLCHTPQCSQYYLLVKVDKTNWFTYRFTFRRSHHLTSANTINNQYISYDSQGYLYPGTKNHYHSIVSVYNIIHDEDLDDESVTNPYLTPIYEAWVHLKNCSSYRRRMEGMTMTHVDVVDKTLITICSFTFILSNRGKELYWLNLYPEYKMLVS